MNKNRVINLAEFAVFFAVSTVIVVFTTFSGMEASVVYWAIQNLVPATGY